MPSSLGYEPVEIPSLDGLIITGDLYRSGDRGAMLLCHRSHCNRAEYRETAPRLASRGFTCLAIDLRSGMKVFGETNLTSQRAKEKGLPTGYLDARPDLEAGIEYLYRWNGNRPITVLGSSYSASLALVCAANNPKVRSVVVFSPGEYLKGVDVRGAAKLIQVPVFATSAKAEVEATREVMGLVDAGLVRHHVPTVEGFHGSKTLWKSVPGSQEYWTALERFLEDSATP